MAYQHFFSFCLALVGVVLAAPFDIRSRGTVSIASGLQVDSFTPYIQFARAAYCTNGDLKWDCGDACNSAPDFVIYAGGGDGAATPHWFVGWSPSLNSVIISHEGTDPTQFLSILDDVEIISSPLDQSYFPGLSQSIQVHSGFQHTFASSADLILSTVIEIISVAKVTHVVTVGHSLGGALAMLDAVFLSKQLPGISIKTIVFGVPRVGNAAFADYFSTFDLTRVTHFQDPVPIVPGRFLGYVHPQGEVHQTVDGRWFDCGGEDNTDIKCSTGAVPNLLLGNILDHLGPYSNILMGTPFC